MFEAFKDIKAAHISKLNLKFQLVSGSRYIYVLLSRLHQK